MVTSNVTPGSKIMAILQECPICKNKQSVKSKKCKCGADLDKMKNAGKTRYWIQYRLPNGKQKKEFVRDPKNEKDKGSYNDAVAAHGKRFAQKKEDRIMDMMPEAKITFNELAEWYVNLTSIQELKYYKDLKNNLNSFNEVFGGFLINEITPEDLREYQLKRKKEGYSDSYIDKHIGATRTMINRAFENSKVSGDTLKPFKIVKRLLKNNMANARKRILTHEEFLSLIQYLPIHLKPIAATGYYTGMRIDEILSLTWDKLDIKKRFIYLEAPDTKDKEERVIPINADLLKYLENIPQGLHSNHVFLYRGEPIKDIRTGLINACEKAGVLYGQKIKGGFIFHDLRHTFNTNMRKAGVADSVIMAITGHSTREMFDRYNTIDKNDMCQGIEKMEVFLANVTLSVTPDTKKGS